MGSTNKGFGKTIMKDPKGYFTIEQVKHILDEALKDNLRDYILILTLFKTGRRISELLSITKGDIDFENKRVLFPVLKRRSPFKRWFVVDSEVIVALKSYIKHYNIVIDDDKLFQITRQRAFQIVRKYCKKAGIEWVGEKKPHPHHFRHAFAIAFIQAGNNQIEDLKILQDYLGHESIDSTACYLQFDKNLHRSKLEKVPKVILSTSEKPSNPTKNDTDDKKTTEP